MKPRLLLIMLLVPSVGFAQRVQTGIAGDSLRVGDPFRAVVRVELPPGMDVVLPDSLPGTEDIENSGRMRVRRDTVNGVLTVSAAYPLTAWRPGSLPLPALTLVFKSGATEKTASYNMPNVPVISVLPADTTNIQPKPAKDVLGGVRLWWLWLLALLLLLIALGLAYWWWRRRRKEEPVQVIPAIMPRARALAELDRIAGLGLVEEGQFKRHYTLTAEVLRQYMQTVNPAWSTDLTTEELTRKVGHAEDVRAAIMMLRNSDLVKFARHTPEKAEALRDFDRARSWIVGYPPPPAAQEQAA